MLGLGYMICMFVAVYLSYRHAGLALGGLRKTPYYEYGSMELEWYESATPTTCGCCLGPFMILASVYLVGFENSPTVLGLFIIAAIFGMLGGIAVESPKARKDDARDIVG